MKKHILMAAVLSVVTPSLFAGEVAAGDVTTFTAGTAAKAGEVNATFQALIAAINDNAERISNLESTQVNASVAGGSFQIRTLNSEIAVGSADGYHANDDNDFTNISNGGIAGSLSFDAEGSGGSFVVTGDHVYEANLPGNHLENHGGDDLGLSAITYTQSGNIVSVAFPDDGGTSTVDFIVSANGSVILAQSIEAFNTTFDDGSKGKSSYTELVIGIRTE
ncbi:MAG: hypothetical protein P1U47_10375 [Zhongshania sp.]|uniref:hypothetical protein n=1 Tax=Zhongshania sp. TaxID=1971902 RepID=UPI002619D187|nr:hypothetical protein [Zhongshania sp.]MDF1692770.1 hypothetical protein [Zhongshania sp.]